VRRIVAALVSAVTALSTLGLLVATAGGLIVAPVTVVPDHPFASCDISSQDTEGGTNYLNAEVEPWVAVNPTNPRNIIAVFQQDRWSNGGARGLVAAATHNGGASWSTSWAHFTTCSGGTVANGGNYDRASDPWVTFSPNGDAYQIAINFDLGPVGFGSVSAVTVSKSTNGGDSWSEPVTLIKDTSPNALNDKESITADPGNANYVYAVWDRLVSPTVQANPHGFEHALGYRGPTWFSRTTDGGRSWEPARIIYDPGEINQTIANQIVVLPDGTLVDVMDLIFNFKNAHQARGFNIAVMRSTDKGLTWSKPIIISKQQDAPVSDPTTGAPVRTGDIIPNIAVDRTTGNLYVVWQDGRFSSDGHAGIAFSKSTDGGLTWSAPVQINTVPSTQAFTPSVAVAADGTIGVTYYDFRNDTSSPPLTTDYWIVHSHDGGATWTEDHVAGPFDMTNAPVARGYFVGDYEGLASIGRSFVPLFIQTTSSSSNMTDPFFTIASPSARR